MRIGTVGLALLTLWLGPAAAPRGPLPPPVDVGRPLNATAAVRIFSMAGTITVVGWDRDSVHVRGTVGAGLTPRSGGTATGFKFSTYDGDQSPESPSHLEIRLPRRAHLWIKTTTAAIDARAVAGMVELYTIDGDIGVDGSASALTAETMRGAIAVRGTPRWVRARSGTGAVTFDGAASDVALSTVSGRIESSTRFARGHFESVDGDIHLAGALPGPASVDVDSHAGAVSLRLDAPTNATFTVYSVGGRIVNALSTVQARRASGTGRELAFSVGTGTARVTVRTFDGAVTLGRR